MSEATAVRAAPEAPHCIVCGGHEGPVVFAEAGYAGRACPCGATFLDPVPSPDAVDPTRDPHPESFYALAAARKVAWLMRSHPGGRLLEVGAGEGAFLAEAARRGFDCAALEPEPGRAERLARRLGIEVERALLEDSRWPDASCDVVFHCDLLSHFPDPVGALRRMVRMLRPGGVLFFEVGLVGGLAPRWYERIGGLGLPTHRWFFSEPALHALMARADLTIERSERFGLAPVVLARRGVAHLRRAASRPPPEAPPATSGEASGRERIESFLRYGVGRLAPGVGPQTCWVVARPGATHG